MSIEFSYCKSENDEVLCIVSRIHTPYPTFLKFKSNCIPTFVWAGLDLKAFGISPKRTTGQTNKSKCGALLTRDISCNNKWISNCLCFKIQFLDILKVVTILQLLLYNLSF